MTDVEKVHVVFKTHLDIGFTDMAAHVVDQFIESYIPKAISLAEALRAEGGDARFVWTTGSWLIHEYVKRADETRKAAIDRAIRDGVIAWHGLPFTTHTELLDPGLLEYGISIGIELDRRYGKTTIAAKMTDVPGHTRALVPYLAQAGVRFLHIGVNPASKVPEVPPLFVWRGRDGAEVIVNYAGNYGNELRVDGLKEVMVFAHTGDNCGPPSAEEVKREFRRLRERYPNAVVQASTLDAFAAALLPLRERLPVVTEEIGDTWIHGAATDPKKVARYRALLRLRTEWLASGRLRPGSREHTDFSDALLLIAEHTWGMDEKKWLTDFRNYDKVRFAAARAADRIGADALPEKYRYIGAFYMEAEDDASRELFGEASGPKSYARFEASWREQRAYLDRAVEALSEEKRAEARRAFAELDMAAPEDGPEALRVGVPHELGRFLVTFAQDGSISGLADDRGKTWADDTHRIGAFLYETFGPEDYNRWFEQYVEHAADTHSWSDADFGKPGLELTEPKPRPGRYRPILRSLTVARGIGGDRVVARSEMEGDATERYGAPRSVTVVYDFPKDDSRVDVSLRWSGKDANRQPEALWCSFAPVVGNPNLWKMDKAGEGISPLEVVRSGNRNLHGVRTGVHYEGADGRVSVLTRDAPIVAPGEPRLLRFDHTFAPLDGGFHFLLFNNVWGTNFPMWYEEDAAFRFTAAFGAN